jgi:hypothetical protein
MANGRSMLFFLDEKGEQRAAVQVLEGGQPLLAVSSAAGGKVTIGVGSDGTPGAVMYGPNGNRLVLGVNPDTTGMMLYQGDRKRAFSMFSP